MAEDRKEYRFKCGIRAYQEECTLKQDKEILKLLSSVDVGEGKVDLKQFTFEKIVELVSEQGVLEKFLDIVLTVAEEEERGTQDWGDLKRSEVTAVIHDFFTLSPVLKMWLGTGKFAAGLLSALGSRANTSTRTLSETINNTELTPGPSLQDTSEEQTKS
jgi:hypothetical protein